MHMYVELPLFLGWDVCIYPWHVRYMPVKVSRSTTFGRAKRVCNLFGCRACSSVTPKTPFGALRTQTARARNAADGYGASRTAAAQTVTG
eukprot:scaffold9511_cov21-Prasinocladus_malaysianus.AAC.1